MRSLYFLVLVLLGAFSTQAQNHGSVGGMVTTSEGAPAEFVNVMLKGTSKGATADRKGRFVIAPVVPGNYTIVASFVGLETQEREIVVVTGQRVNVDFSLKESAEQLDEIVIAETRGV